LFKQLFIKGSKQTFYRLEHRVCGAVAGGKLGKNAAATKLCKLQLL
jgi:hypothetical protein